MLKQTPIGGNTPISVQSMTRTNTKDITATINQINLLELHGCDIIRVAVPDLEAVQALKEITQRVSLPVVADVHFDPNLALQVINTGIACIRINPGTINKQAQKEIILKAKEHHIPIRIGINSGSLPRDLEPKTRTPKNLAEAMVKAALQMVELCEKNGHYELKISLKAPDVPTTLLAYRSIASKTDIPLHLGITEAGLNTEGIIRSSIGIGILLCEGIGDTIRVSLCGDPIKEVQAGLEILKTLGLKHQGIHLICCPMCARTKIEVKKIALELNKSLKESPYINKLSLRIAVMGCEVNGPKEAKEADIGIAGTKKGCLLFQKGKILNQIDPKEINQIILEKIVALSKQS